MNGVLKGSGRVARTCNFATAVDLLLHLTIGAPTLIIAATRATRARKDGLHE